jgi:predicted polyphosphate/ATP-dependent NAD kinase
MVNLGVDLIIFSGGDGTARDLYEAINGRIPVIGIPSGVKIHSSVFAISPSAAGDIAVKFIDGEITSIHDSEVLDIDENAFRENRLSAKLYGFLRVPHEEALLQTSKEVTPTSEEENLKAIAADIIDEMETDTLYILGPGSTTRTIAEHIGVQKTLLGVDVIQNRKLILGDANENQLLEILDEKKAKIIVTIIGGQGFVFGRGNQQISPRVIRVVGIKNILVVATPVKIASLHGRPLLVDTGDQELDAQLSGYIRVITDYGRRIVYRIKGD